MSLLPLTGQAAKAAAALCQDNGRARGAAQARVPRASGRML
ncbi:hypothetical protein [Streptomyces sp. DSM 118878]